MATMKTAGDSGFRVLLAGKRRNSIKRRLKEHAPALSLVTAGKGAPPDLVAMAAEDYRELLDKAEDAAATMAYHATRGEESVPSEIVDRLLAGENPIRVWRRHRGLSLQALAHRIGGSKSYLSEIETRKKRGSIDVMRAIAEALDVDLDDLV